MSKELIDLIRVIDNISNGDTCDGECYKTGEECQECQAKSFMNQINDDANWYAGHYLGGPWWSDPVKALIDELRNGKDNPTA